MIIEHLTFSLADGADEAAFLAADVEVQTTDFPFRAGAIRRTTARDEAGRWLVETFWYSADDAVGGENDLLDGFVDHASLTRTRWATLD